MIICAFVDSHGHATSVRLVDGAHWSHNLPLIVTRCEWICPVQSEPFLLAPMTSRKSFCFCPRLDLKLGVLFLPLTGRALCLSGLHAGVTSPNDPWVRLLCKRQACPASCEVTNLPHCYLNRSHSNRRSRISIPATSTKAGRMSLASGCFRLLYFPMFSKPCMYLVLIYGIDVLACGLPGFCLRARCSSPRCLAMT